MTNLTDLIARVEAAEGPDRELDAEIWAVHHKRDWPVEGVLHQSYIDSAARYTALLDVAMTLVPDDHQWAAGSCGENDGPWACVTLQDFDAGCPDFTSSAATEALCLVAASLKAMESSHEG